MYHSGIEGNILFRIESFITSSLSYDRAYLNTQGR